MLWVERGLRKGSIHLHQTLRYHKYLKVGFWTLTILSKEASRNTLIAICLKCLYTLTHLTSSSNTHTTWITHCMITIITVHCAHSLHFFCLFSGSLSGFHESHSWHSSSVCIRNVSTSRPSGKRGPKSRVKEVVPNGIYLLWHGRVHIPSVNPNRHLHTAIFKKINYRNPI